MAENAPKRSFASFSGNWTLVLGLCGSLLFILFDRFHDPGRGQAAAIGAMMIAAVIKYFWDLKKRIWFWITIAMIGLAHVSLVRFIAWPYAALTYVALLPVGCADFYICYLIVGSAERVIEGRRVPELKSEPK